MSKKIRDILNDNVNTWIAPKFGRCKLAEHKIELSDKKGIYHRPRPQNQKLQLFIDTLIKELLESVVAPGKAPFSEPIAVVNKADKLFRMCVDYRKLNDKRKSDFCIQYIGVEKWILSNESDSGGSL